MASLQVTLHKFPSLVVVVVVQMLDAGLCQEPAHVVFVLGLLLSFEKLSAHSFHFDRRHRCLGHRQRVSLGNLRPHLLCLRQFLLVQVLVSLVIDHVSGLDSFVVAVRCLHSSLLSAVA